MVNGAFKYGVAILQPSLSYFERECEKSVMFN